MIRGFFDIVILVSICCEVSTYTYERFMEFLYRFICYQTIFEWFHMIPIKFSKPKYCLLG